MTEEQMKIEAEIYASKYGQANYMHSVAYRAHLAGARSRDAEIKDMDLAYNNLLHSFKERGTELAKQSEELDKLRNPWICIDDRLPEYGERVLMLTKEGVAFTCEYLPLLASDDSEITHWMPIPKLTKGE